jgi:arylsulfatase A-like enzyme
MVSALDDGIGAVMAELRAQGLERDTVVIFLSDNGCAGYINGGCTNAPLEGAKATPWEGGLRVPFVIAAPGRLPAGRVDGRIVSSLDVLPTAVAMAGAAKPANLDGVDLFPGLAGRRRGDFHPALMWRMGPNHAVREGRWKLIVVNKSETSDDLSRILGSPVPDGVPATVGPLGQWVLLYDLQADPGETRDVAAEHPEVVRRLAARFTVWDRGNVAPMFTSRRQVQTVIGGRGVQLFN